MTRLTRWEPMRDMLTTRDMFDRFFGDEFGDRRQTLGAVAPAVDMYLTDDDVIVKATLPGVKPEAIQISISGDALTLRGEVSEANEVSQAAYHLKERPAVRLPAA